MPIVYGTPAFAQDRLERKMVNPAVTMSTPRRLSGRRTHATTPAST